MLRYSMQVVTAKGNTLEFNSFFSCLYKKKVSSRDSQCHLVKATKTRRIFAFTFPQVEKLSFLIRLCFFRGLEVDSEHKRAHRFLFIGIF